ncbi:hypothetical protein ACIQVR_37455 [Streptomyces xanthochromogenes]|uniref:hypothetical protein n=1 Tax=Streptomyces xanthochromogenes TaxID=67384 RepID=UPI0037F27F5E
MNTNRIEELLSRALLVRDRAVPRDIVPTTGHAAEPVSTAADLDGAAEDLRALCETLVAGTPARDVATFVTDQIPEPRSALVLACVLQLTDTTDGARFWWEYAAGAGQSAAAYCLYLHHLALGDRDAAAWWHRQTDDTPPAHDPAPPESHPSTAAQPAWRTAAHPAWHAANHRVTNSTTTILRVLRHLAKQTARPRTAAVTELMTYVPNAVAVGYLRQPDMDLPMPGPDFARQITTRLEATTTRPTIDSRLPARTHKPPQRQGPEASLASTKTSETPRPQVGETATR